MGSGMSPRVLETCQKATAQETNHLLLYIPRDGPSPLGRCTAPSRQAASTWGPKHARAHHYLYFLGYTVDFLRSTIRL